MPVAYLGDDSQCIVELAIKREIDGKQRWVLTSIDHFLIGEDGKIVSLTVLIRPPARGQ